MITMLVMRPRMRPSVVAQSVRTQRTTSRATLIIQHPSAFILYNQSELVYTHIAGHESSH